MNPPQVCFVFVFYVYVLRIGFALLKALNLCIYLTTRPVEVMCTRDMPCAWQGCEGAGVPINPSKLLCLKRLGFIDALLPAGLDSFAALSVMGYLQHFAQATQQTVIVTIHQPRSAIWEMFDTVSLLASGRLMYHGRCAEMVPWFNTLGYQYVRGGWMGLQNQAAANLLTHACMFVSMFECLLLS